MLCVGILLRKSHIEILLQAKISYVSYFTKLLFENCIEIHICFIFALSKQIPQKFPKIFKKGVQFSIPSETSITAKKEV